MLRGFFFLCGRIGAIQAAAALRASRTQLPPRRRFATGACCAISSAIQSTKTRTFALTAVGVT
ncbi:hypothetical protein [Burkholderia ubonensis]|uniref:hypothetical protein n=1 Tax=Burkholderia ubonensis TaxID=101571 RepID=UPI00075CD46C|nr:hypothetical protein [Burkholderia ubonensis]KWK66030.1 hypothetical protein WM15_09500 [Burkholderia ubonensis]